MKVLVIGSGGREHALADTLASSNLVSEVFVAPGNAGTALQANLQNVDIAADDIPALLTFAQQQGIDLTVVGPELPLVMGVVDTFTEAGLKIFGPTQAAAQLEGSKAFTKRFLQQYAIPTADYEVFTVVDDALAYVRKQGAPIVIKADGLAAGKGVIVAMTLAEAEAAIIDMLSGNAFGEAGSQVVIEEFLNGEEASFIVMADGSTALPFATSQDHKRVGDGDTGPNTGGMGAYSPAPVVTPEIHQRIMDEVIVPTMKGMANEGMPYTGFLYAGLMISDAGEPKVIEFNCRFGDPETQPIMQRLESDLAELCLLALDGKLAGHSINFSKQVSVGVVLAAGGYPQSYAKGEVISGLERDWPQGTKIYHAGTRLQGEQIVTNGGRVLCVTCLGDTIKQAMAECYQQIEHITFKDMYYRKDIAYRAIAREE